jgi:hypothetical protein
MPVKLIINPTPEEALAAYPKGDHPWTVLTTERHQVLARRPLQPLPLSIARSIPDPDPDQ